MALLSRLFDSPFFELPLLEGLMYLAVVLTAGAALVGMVRRLTGTSSELVEYPEEAEWKQAA